MIYFISNLYIGSAISWNNNIIVSDTNQKTNYRKSFESQTEEDYFSFDLDITYSHLIRYMPPQWHYSTYFMFYYVPFGKGEIHFKNKEIIILKPSKILIMAPFTEHATPCLSDNTFLEFFIIRSSSFDRVFWEQLKETSIMSHFFRNALRNAENKESYICFDTNNDSDVASLIESIKTELQIKLPYSTPLILLCLLCFQLYLDATKI